MDRTASGPLSVADLVRTFTDATYPGSPLYSRELGRLAGSRRDQRAAVGLDLFEEAATEAGLLVPAARRACACGDVTRDCPVPTASRAAGDEWSLFVPDTRKVSERSRLSLMADRSSTSPIRRLKEVTFDEAKERSEPLVQGDIDLLEHVPPAR